MRILLILYSLAAFAFAGPEEAAITAAEKTWSTSIVKQDWAKLEALLADDLVYYHSSGVIDSKKSYLESVKTGALKYIGVDYEKQQIRVYGNTAVLNATFRVRANDHGTMVNNHLLLTHVFVKQGGTWRLVSHQTTKIP
jgi:ketosteroid isomerase-like protein